MRRVNAESTFYRPEGKLSAHHKMVRI